MKIVSVNVGSKFIKCNLGETSCGAFLPKYKFDYEME